MVIYFYFLFEVIIEAQRRKRREWLYIGSEINDVGYILGIIKFAEEGMNASNDSAYPETFPAALFRLQLTTNL